jgi:hypothetical protein
MAFYVVLRLGTKFTRSVASFYGMNCWKIMIGR